MNLVSRPSEGSVANGAPAPPHGAWTRIAPAARVLAVFHGNGAGFWAGLCGRPGFRHCFVTVAAGAYWIKLDGTAGRPALEVVTGSGYDLAGHYRRSGLTVVETRVRHAPTWWPWMTANCVGAAKKVLGVGAPWVLTPWRLYRHLISGAGARGAPRRHPKL